jgi:hypothetical protein
MSRQADWTERITTSVNPIGTAASAQMRETRSTGVAAPNCQSCAMVCNDSRSAITAKMIVAASASRYR